MEYRVEHDTLGEVRVPADAYWGAQTQRAIENFRVSGHRFPPSFIWAQAVIKRAAAIANQAVGRLDPQISQAIVTAAEEIMGGGMADQFVLDVFQAGAGTSQNMNINEVIANRAAEILGGRKGDYSLVHPNDHVNLAQSTNDTIHAAIHIAGYRESQRTLLPAIAELQSALSRKAIQFDHVVKTGRTHLQDAVPIRLGQEFGAYASMVQSGQRRLMEALDGLLALGIGGTAVGTGLNASPGFRPKVIAAINEATGYPFRQAENMFEAMQSFNAVLAVTGALRGLIVDLHKLASDLRLLSSGPSTGLAEIQLPAVQPGSSIMPGKVNPVMAEMMEMVCLHCLGLDAAITAAASAGQLELNVMMPIIAYDFLQEIEILSGGIKCFTSRCIEGIKADEDRCAYFAERSPALVTALSPYLGYERAAAIAREALASGLTIRQLVLGKKLIDEARLEEILDLHRLTEDPEQR